MIPIVIESSSQGERAYDIYSRMLEDRLIFIGSEIDDDLGTSVVSQLLYLQQQEAEKEIKIYIMSGGGSVVSAFAIYDTIRTITCPVSTYCVGYAYSAAALLLASGKKGFRFSLPSSRIMLHQPWSVVGGRVTDISIQAEEMKKIKERVCQMLSFHTGQTVSRIIKDCEDDFYMSAEEAKKYGLVDEIIEWKKA
jgi:ATP-dependent Clp protease protease subunit